MYKRQKLNIALDQGGVPTLMSVIHDGLVGDTKMINDPNVAQAVTNYNANQIGFEELRDVVVNRYMNVIEAQSKTGYKVKQDRINTNLDNPGSKVYNSPEYIGYHEPTGGRMFTQNIRGTNQVETYYIDPSTGAKVMLNQKQQNNQKDDKAGLGPVYGPYIPNKGQGDNQPAQTGKEKEITALMKKYPQYSREQVEKMYDTIPVSYTHLTLPTKA